MKTFWSSHGYDFLLSFAEYPSDFRPELHGNCIHWKSQKLYIFDRRQFAILDMKRKKWTISGGDRARFMSYESFNEMEYNPHGHGPMINTHPMDQMQGLGVRPQMKSSQSTAKIEKRASLQCRGKEFELLILCSFCLFQYFSCRRTRDALFPICKVSKHQHWNYWGYNRYMCRYRWT